eukprot:CAMPEP_0178857806 /NCGR_PEP_ID=MMETSP0747-20121128/329_1 /TAXON_ID=913974 /ORGANISM="Nitzschia punctata, Strain CCMP561" /LENGTH=105 /DNA_ID=CAMNT_0020524063 /DNA_START=263 /DNA_END=578 /DNA_ORIENTATION=+
MPPALTIEYVIVASSSWPTNIMEDESPGDLFLPPSPSQILFFPVEELDAEAISVSIPITFAASPKIILNQYNCRAPKRRLRIIITYRTWFLPGRNLLAIPLFITW